MVIVEGSDTAKQLVMLMLADCIPPLPSSTTVPVADPIGRDFGIFASKLVTGTGLYRVLLLQQYLKQKEINKRKTMCDSTTLLCNPSKQHFLLDQFLVLQHR